MIIKSFNLKDLNTKSDLFLFYGENEGHKEEIINSYFLKEFDGEIIKYDENQILDNKNDFFETCLNESLFSNKKFILISRVTTKKKTAIRTSFIQCSKLKSKTKLLIPIGK